MWPFSKNLDSRAHEAMDRVEKRIDGLIKSEHEARMALSAANTELSAVNAKLAALRVKVREQTEADLYFVSAKIMRDLLATGKAAPELVQMQNAFQNSLHQLQAQSAYNSPYGLAGLGGLAGAFSHSQPR